VIAAPASPAKIFYPLLFFEWLLWFCLKIENHWLDKIGPIFKVNVINLSPEYKI